MNYAQFYALHQRLFATPINYHIKYDAHNWVVSSQKVAARVFIDIQVPNAPVRQLEVFVIAHFNVDHRLTALYELTYPDWSHAVSQVSQS